MDLGLTEVFSAVLLLASLWALWSGLVVPRRVLEDAKRFEMVNIGPVSDLYAVPSGLVMGDVELSQGQVQEMQDRIQAAGGWCAPSEVIYMKDPPPAISPTGFIPDLNDVMTLDERRQEMFDRWEEEDEWLRKQYQLALLRDIDA